MKPCQWKNSPEGRGQRRPNFIGLKSKEDASTFVIQKIFCQVPSLLGCPIGYPGIDCMELPQSPARPLSSKSKSTKGIFSESLSSKTSLSTAFLGGLRFVLTAGTPGICMPIRLLGRYGSAERDRLRFLHGAPHAHTQAACSSWLPTTITSNAPAITVVSK